MPKIRLPDGHQKEIPKNTTCCIILGGITNYNECENNKIKTRKINTINIPKLAIKILSKKILFLWSIFYLVI